MSRSIFVALAVLGLSTAGFATEVDRLVAAGDEALRKFELQKASLAYREALKLDPRNYDACWRYARALIDEATLTGDRDKQKPLYIAAEGYARAAVRANLTGSKGHAFLAIAVGKLALYHGGRTQVELSKEVKTEAEKAIALDPKDDLPYHVLGIWNREMAQLNWFLRSVAEILYGKFPPASMEEALKDLRLAGRLSPSNVAHQVEIGVTLADAGKPGAARETLEHALAMPQTWVTDDVYRKKARATLELVNRHPR